MGLAWRRSSDEARRDRRGVVDDIVSLLIDMGFPLDDPGWPSPPSRPPSGWTRAEDVGRDLPLVAARAVARLRRVPLAEIRRGAARDSRGDQERSIARELNIPEGNAALEESRVRTLFSSGRGVRDPSRRGDVAPAVPRKPGRWFWKNRRRRSGPHRTGGASRRAGKRNGPAGKSRRVHRADRDPGRPVLVPGRTFHREADHRGDPPRRSGEPPGPGVVGGPDRGRSRGSGSPRFSRPWRRSTV